MGRKKGRKDVGTCTHTLTSISHACAHSLVGHLVAVSASLAVSDIGAVNASSAQAVDEWPYVAPLVLRTTVDTGLGC